MVEHENAVTAHSPKFDYPFRTLLRTWFGLALWTIGSGLSIGTLTTDTISVIIILLSRFNVHTTHICSVQLFSLLVVAEGALVCPPLGHGLQLLTPDHLLHVGGCGLGPAQAAGLLSLFYEKLYSLSCK